MRITKAFRAARRTPLLQVVKSAVAIAVAWLATGWLVPGPPPVFAAIAALLVVQPSLNQSFTKAVERSVGVITGVVIASLLGIALGSGSSVILLATLVALVVAWVLRMTPGTTNQVAISALLVLALGTATPDYAVHRVIETLVGALIGVLVNVALVPPVAVAPARTDADALCTALADALDRLAAALTSNRTPAQLTELLLEARLLRPMVRKAEDDIDAAADSLTLNPRARTHRADLEVSRALVERYAPMVTQVIGMTRAYVDHYDADLVDEPTVHAIADQLRRAAHDVRLDPTLLRTPTGAPTSTTPASGSPSTAGASPAPESPSDVEQPALTAPLQITTPSAAHWVLIGSLLEDLHRIHAELVETPVISTEPPRGRRR